MSDQVDIIGQSFVDGLRRILGAKLYGAYIFGAAALRGAVPARDIDFHVILSGELTGGERCELERLHETLAQQFPPLGIDMDGYYILLRDARLTAPPRSEMWARATDVSWALHREHLRAGRCIILHGPEPKEIYPPATWPEVEHALRGELGYAEDHLQDYPDYCILNLCRLMYSFETKDVIISKYQAADWAHDALPEWRRHIELASKSYAGLATSEDRQFMLAGVEKFLEFAKGRIERARKGGTDNRARLR